MEGHGDVAVSAAIRAEGEVGSARSIAPAACRKSSSVPSFAELSHFDPFCRMVPAGPRRWRWVALASSYDASLSAPTSWPCAPGIGLASPLADGARGAGSGSDLQHAGATLGAARAGRSRRTVDRDSSHGRGELERGSARRGRARKLPATRSSMPPISGHGAQTVMKVRSSEPIGAPEGLELQPRGLRLLAARSSTPAPPPTAKSSPVNGELRPRPTRDLHRLAADPDARRHTIDRLLRVLAPDDCR